MIVRPGLFIDPVQEIAAKKDSYNTKTGKNNHKWKTYLSKQGKRKVAVIPDPHIQPLIYNNSGNEFHTCYKNNTSQHLPPERFFPSYHLPLYCDEHKADSAKNEHCPVGKSAEYHFKPIIQTASDCPQKQDLT